MKKLHPFFLTAGCFVFFFLIAVASMPTNRSYQSKPRPCITHAPITGTPIMIRVYISGSYNMKDLSGAQISGRDLLVAKLNNYNYGKYKLADGGNVQLTFNITVNEYSSYYGAEVRMSASDGNCKSNGKFFNYCEAFKRFETNYVTPDKLFDDMASIFNGFVTGGWCTDCPSPCNPY